ncbi:MAG TPA: hypothetical protein VFB69_07765 [Candidatus Dormibacteraeota bacterium]|nr:hypothetical protein [Candidatus Dormibacteraeota bacterium]
MFEEVDIEPWNDVTPAAWMRPRLRPFIEFVAGSVIPTGFEAYARIDNERYGKLDADFCTALIEVLLRHTAAPETLWLAVWNGYGGLYADAGIASVSAFWTGPGDPPPVDRPALRQAPRRHLKDPLIKHDSREFLLYRGRPEVVPGWLEGPNLWWPDDQAWCVATEIDLPWTYVGGSKALIEDVLAADRLGAKPLSLDESTLARDHAELRQRT